MGGNSPFGVQVVLARYLRLMQQQRTQGRVARGSMVAYRILGVLGNQGKMDDLSTKMFISVHSFGQHESNRLTFKLAYLHSFSFFIFTYEIEALGIQFIH